MDLSPDEEEMCNLLIKDVWTDPKHTLGGMPTEILQRILVLLFAQFVIRPRDPLRPSPQRPRHQYMAVFLVCRRFKEVAEQVFIQNFCLRIPGRLNQSNTMVPAALPPSLAAKLSANLRYLEMPLMAVASLRWDGVLRGFSGLRELCIRPFAIQVPGPADLPDEWDVRGPLPPSLRAPLQALRFSFGLPHSWPGDVSWRRLLLPVSNELLHFGLAVRKLKSRRLARHIPVPNLLPITHPDYACRTAEYKRSYWLAIYILEWMMDLRRHVFLSVQGDEPETHWVYAHVANGHIDFLRIFYSTLLVMWQEGDPNGLPALRTTLLERQTMGVGPLKIKLAIQLFIQRPEEDKVHLCEIEWDLLKEWYWDVPVSQPYVPEPRDQAAFDQLLGRAVDIEWV